MKNLKMLSKLICVIALVGSPLSSYADTGVEGGSSTTSTQPSVNQSASKSSSGNKSGQMLSYVASAIEIGVAQKFWPQCPENGSACVIATIFTVMAMQSKQQGDEHGRVATASGYTADATNAYDSSSYDTARQAAIGNEYLKKAEAGINSLKGSGYINATGTKVTSPDGKTYNVNELTSPAAMQAAGIPKAAIDSAMATYAKIEKQAKEKLKIGAQTAASGFEEGGGGGVGGFESGGSDGTDDPMAMAGGKGLGKDSLSARDPSSLAAGMSKNYNGEPIGVAADSIFLMMTRRYKVKESQDSFFGANDLLLKK